MVYSLLIARYVPQTLSACGAHMPVTPTKEISVSVVLLYYVMMTILTLCLSISSRLGTRRRHGIQKDSSVHRFYICVYRFLLMQGYFFHRCGRREQLYRFLQLPRIQRCPLQSQCHYVQGTA